MKTQLLAIFTIAVSACYGQQSTNAIPFNDTIFYTKTGDEYKFNAQLRPLVPIAGAPEPYYRYFWEFGDGNYSFEKEPLYSFTDSKEYQVRLWATNYYDNGRRPIPRPSTLAQLGVMKSGVNIHTPKKQAFKDENQLLALFSNSDPRPNESMICVMSYRIKEKTPESIPGTIALFFNEKEFGKDNFNLDDTRFYAGEKEADVKTLYASVESSMHQEDNWIAYNSHGPSVDIGEVAKTKLFDETFSAALKNKMNLYKNINVWKTELKGGDTKNAFFEFKTTPEMIKDTNATVVITAVFIPDNPQYGAEMVDLEMQIVASHDPNRMKVQRNALNYRWVGKSKKMKYTIQFQNNGKGPAKRIELQTKLPSYIDPATIKVVDLYPKCAICTDGAMGSCLDTTLLKDSAVFTFTNIYLPGSNQEGVNDYDSTKGFVTFEANFNKKVEKRPFSGRTAIIFDKNPPIITNYAKTRFRPGLSVGVIAGYYSHAATLPENSLKKDITNWPGKKQFLLGATASVYSAYKPYLQGEANLRYQPYEVFGRHEVAGGGGATGFVLIDRKEYKVKSRVDYYSKKAMYTDVVGIMRYSLNNFVGVEAGALFSFTLNSKLKKYSEYELYQFNSTSLFKYDSLLASETVKGFKNMQPAGILGVYLGSVRRGPAVGFRYLYYMQQPKARFLFYAAWKL